MRLKCSSCALATTGALAFLLGAAGGAYAQDAAATDAEVAIERSERTAAPAEPDSAAARTALYDEANAVRDRIEANQVEGAQATLGALAERIDTLARLSDRAHVAIHLGRSEIELGDRQPAAARDQSRLRAARLFARAAADAEECDDARLAAYAWGYLAEPYLDAGRMGDARVATERAIEYAALAAAPDAEYRFLAQLGAIFRREGDLDAAIAADRRAVAIVARLSEDLASDSLAASFAFREQVEPVYTSLVDALLARAAQSTPETAQPLLREARDTLEALKTAELRDHYGDDCLASQQRVATDDLPGAVVLYPVILPDRVELIVGADGVLSLHRSPMPPDALDAQVGQMRRFVASAMTRRYLRPAAALYAGLIAPIADRLDDADVLVVVPGGALRTIPFSALYDEARSAHLIEDIAVVTSPGLSLTEPRPFSGKDTPVLAAGLSEARLGFSALPSVDTEIEGIAASFPTTELMNSALTGERLDGEVASQAVGVVHIATHAEFDADASQSFIVTWDEKLPMDAFAATIARTARRNAAPLELLVLSACETAAGDEQAALGLAGIAIQSGARSAVASLWSVNDRATQQLIDRFYRQLATGQSRAESLRSAQRALIADDTFSHPAFWSSFLLISSWL